MNARSAWVLFPWAPKEQRVTGSLSLLPLVALLEAVERSGQDCRLTIQDPSGGNLLIVVFRAGQPVMVFSPGDGRSLGELLLDAGLIDRETLTELLVSRATARGPLEHLLRQRTGLREEELQRFLDFQGRARFLEAFGWPSGSFELERYAGDEESEFRLQLPSFAALAMRAQARAANLAQILPTLPAPPEHLLVRPLKASPPPGDGIEGAVLAALTQPRLVPQLVARLLIDDDLVLQAVVELARAKKLLMQPRLTPVASSGEAAAPADTFAGELLRDVVSRLRGGQGGASSALWVLVVGEEKGQGQQVVAWLAGKGDDGPLGAAAPTTVARGRVRFSRDAMLCAVAVEPGSLSRGAMDPLLSRFDVLCAVRGAKTSPRLDSLLEQLATVSGPLVVGLEVGRSSQPWAAAVRGVMRVEAATRRSSKALAVSFLELVHGAVALA